MAQQFRKVPQLAIFWKRKSHLVTMPNEYYVILLGGHQRAGSIYCGLHSAAEKCDCRGRWKIQGHCSERPRRIQRDNQPQFR